MPRQPGGITKFERIQALKAVLGRWGRLEKGQIDEQVGAALSCPAEELKRSLYRDLEELERLGEIVAIHYTRDGQEIENYDPETHKSTLCRWAIPGQEHEILGAQKLRESQIVFHAASRLKDAFQVEDARLSSPGKLSLYFQIEGRSHCLRLERDALPAKILLSRMTSDLTTLELMEIAEEAFGKRASILLVPIGNVSKTKDPNQLGHLCLDFFAPGKLKLLDLGSKNGTFYVPLDAKRAEGLVVELASLGEATITDSASRFREQMEPKLLGTSAEIDLNLPVLVRASSAFEIIII